MVLCISRDRSGLTQIVFDVYLIFILTHQAQITMVFENVFLLMGVRKLFELL
jgi:hypothetical protein